MTKFVFRNSFPSLALSCLLLVSAIASCGMPAAKSRISFTPSPALLSGDEDGAALFKLEQRNVETGRTFTAQMIYQGKEENWIAFHALSNDATQSLGSVIQPYLSEIDTAHGANIVIPFGRESQVTGVIFYENDSGQAWAGTLGVARSWGDHTRAGLDVGLLQEDESFLGLEGGGALQMPDGRTGFAQVWAERRVGETTAAFASWSIGRTNSESFTGDFNGSMSEVQSEAGVIGFRSYGVRRDDDSLSIALSTPLRVTSGRIVLATPGMIEEDGEIRLVEGEGDLAPNGREVRLQLAYDTPLGPNETLGLTVYVQGNPGHDAEADPVYGVGLTYRLAFVSGELLPHLLRKLR